MGIERNLSLPIGVFHKSKFILLLMLYKKSQMQAILLTFNIKYDRIINVENLIFIKGEILWQRKNFF